MQKSNKAMKNMMGGLAALGLASAGFMVAAPAANADTSSDWDRLAECESGGDWSISTGNGYHGGLQFSQESWNAAGGSGSPANASKAEQIQVAEQLKDMQGWGAWPSCSAQLGLSGEASGTPSEEASSAQEQTAQEAEATQQQAEQAEQQQAEQAEQQKQAEQAEQPKQQAETEYSTAQQAPQQAPAEQQPAPEAAPSGETHTVESGDTLSKLSNELGLSSWETLYEANTDQVADPAVIYVGQELQVPAE